MTHNSLQRIVYKRNVERYMVQAVLCKGRLVWVVLLDWKFRDYDPVAVERDGSDSKAIQLAAFYGVHRKARCLVKAAAGEMRVLYQVRYGGVIVSKSKEFPNTKHAWNKLYLEYKSAILAAACY